MLHHVYHFSAGKFSQDKIPVVTEVPLRILVGGREIATMMCTPVMLRELALGFLAFERFIDSMEDVASVEVDEDEVEVHIELNRPLAEVGRRIFTSGCGGGFTFHLDIDDYPPIRTSRQIEPASIITLIRMLGEAAVLYRRSRGIHTAALSDGERLIAVAEDVGRHNALDKLRGQTLERGADTRDHVLVSTGRISSEMLRKAARMQVPFVVSRTSPTSLSIAVAKRLGITLIGYVRRGGFTVYSHPENVRACPEAALVHAENGAVPAGEEARMEQGEGVPAGGRVPGAPPPAVPRGLRRRRRRGSEGRRRKGQKFMDVVDQAFVHQVAVSVWREVEDFLRQAPSTEEGLRRLRDMATFEDRGEYASVWRERWRAAIDGIEPASTPADRFETLREMTQAAMHEEDGARDRAGLPLLIDEAEGQRFMDFTLNYILQEGSGEIEEIEEEEVV